MKFLDLKDHKKYASLVNFDTTSKITLSADSVNDSRVYVENLSEAKLYIGKYCSIAVGVSFYLGGNHNYKRVTTFLPPNGWKSDKNSKPLVTKGDIRIENDVWIGDRATILSGTKIGTGSVIGSGAIVSGVVEPYSIVVGNPAKTIKKRFSEDTIEKMLKYRWWDWKHDIIENYSEYIFSENLNRFFDLCEKLSQEEDIYI